MMRSEVSIRGQIRFLALGVALPLAALTALIITSDFRDTVDAARLELDRLASVTAAGAARYVREVDGVGRRIAASPEIRSLESGTCAETLRPLVNALEHFTTLQVTRVGGDIVCSVPQSPSDAGRDPWDDPWVRGIVATGEPAFGPPALGPDARTSITSVTFPIKGPEGKVVSVLSVQLGMAQMQELVSSNPSEGERLTLTDTASVVLAHSQNPEQWIAQRFPGAPTEDETVDLSLNSGFYTTQAADRVERLFAYRRVEGSPWVVLAGTPTDLIYGPIRATLYPKLGLAALVMMFVALLTWALNHHIGSSLAGLVDDMRAAEEGAGALVPETGPAEVSEVARQYNRMLVERRDAARKPKRP